MSTEAAQDFIDRANQDAAIRKLAREHLGDIVNVGREHGYDFAWDEFDQAMRERKATQGQGGGGPTGGGPTGGQCSMGEPGGRRGRQDEDDSGDMGCCQCGSGGSGGNGMGRR